LYRSARAGAGAAIPDTTTAPVIAKTIVIAFDTVLLLGTVRSINSWAHPDSHQADRHFCSGSLPLASLDRACRNLLPAFPQRSTTTTIEAEHCDEVAPRAAACGGFRIST
jgi:hypothetical protein